MELAETSKKYDLQETERQKIRIGNRNMRMFWNKDVFLANAKLVAKRPETNQRATQIDKEQALSIYKGKSRMLQGKPIWISLQQEEPVFVCNKLLPCLNSSGPGFILWFSDMTPGRIPAHQFRYQYEALSKLVNILPFF